MKKKFMILLYFAFSGYFFSITAIAGDLESPSGPEAAASAMYTIEDLYKRLDTGAEGTKRKGPFTEPAAGPGSTGYTMDDIMGVAPAMDNTGGAVAAEVVTGKTFWGLTNGEWGPQTGTAAGTSSCTGNATAGDVLFGKTFSNATSTGIDGTMPDSTADITPKDTDQAIPAGYHDGTGDVKGDENLASGNIKSGVTIFNISGDPNVVDTSSGDAAAEEILSGKKAWVDGLEITGTATGTSSCTGDATAGDVLFGKTFSNATSTGIDGTMLTQTLLPDNDAVNAGYYGATSLSTVDTDLATGNIRSGVSIFGVAGNPTVVDTSSGDAVAADIADGKKAWVDGDEVIGTAKCITCDGTLSAGGRWCDQGDGTVKDMTTGLVWLQKADWGGLKKWRCADSDIDPYDDAHTRAGILKAGTAGANLSDESVEGDWRLPTKKELDGLVKGTEAVHSVTPQAFTNVQTVVYWSSTTVASLTNYAWVVYIYNGNKLYSNKDYPFYVWPVRSGN
jgi:hypothetical protein